MTTNPLEDDEPSSEREAILGILADQIRDINDRLEELEPDPDDMEAQRMQIRWTRTLGYLVGQYRKLMKDTDIDEMEEEMDLIQTVIEMDNR